MVRIVIAKPGRTPEFMDFDEPEEVVVGRSSRSSVVLESDLAVSRRHAVFLVEPGRARIQDLGSTNGLRINGVLYGGGSLPDALTPVELKDGDEVIIGGTLFRIVLHPACPAGEPSPAAAAADPGELPPLPRPSDSAMETMVSGAVPGRDADPPHVPGYRLMRSLAAGRLGKVYLGVPKGETHSVAVRVMHTEGELTPDLLKLFFSEFETARNVVHPHLARLLGAGELAKGGGVFVTSEYVDGTPLTGYLARRTDGRLLSGEAVGIMLQVAGAVSRLHRQNILHLDLKPSAIIIRNGGGRVVAKVTGLWLSDFTEMAGLSPPAYAGRDTRRLAFLAPEQLSEEVKAGMRADVFALSAMTFAMIAGRPPYKFTEGGDNRAVVERGEMLNLGDMVKGVPEALLEIVKAGLSRDPGHRYGDAGQFLAALETMLG